MTLTTLKSNERQGLVCVKEVEAGVGEWDMRVGLDDRRGGLQGN